MKPVVLIDIPTRHLTDQGRQKILESAHIVTTSFDENNRVKINPSDLKQALVTPVDIDARRRFLDDYLIEPSSV